MSRQTSSAFETGNVPMKEVFQPYLVQYMCHCQNREAVVDGVSDRFILYKAAEDEHLQEEKNFEKTIPREFNRPLLMSDKELRDASETGSLGFIMAYAKKLQEKTDQINVKITTIDSREADELIESDFLKK